jgi:YidC/Oxa1 family membrane protein insertase
VFVSIGVFPILMGVTMWMRQKLNPAPADPTQKMIFAWMPWVFMFMLGHFASGLVIYWCANNIITFTQQYIIMRSQGIEVDLLGNITSGLRRKPPPRPKPAEPDTAAGAAGGDGDGDTPTDESPSQPDAKPGAKPRAKPGAKSGPKPGAKPSGKPSRKRRRGA